MARTTTLKSLKNEDYTDRELLFILDDAGSTDPDGWTTTHDLMESIRISHPDSNATAKERDNHARRCIGSRYAAMVRMGFVERNDERTQWRVSAVGRDLMSGQLTKTLQAALDKMPEANRILVMRALTGSYNRFAPASIMLRREWQHGTARANGSR